MESSQFDSTLFTPGELHRDYTDFDTLEWLLDQAREVIGHPPPNLKSLEKERNVIFFNDS